MKHLCSLICSFRELYQALLSRLTDSKEAKRLQAELEQAKGSVCDLQKLTENLRERLAESDSNHRQEMSDLHACYKKQVQDLSEKLLLANNTIGIECRSKALLEKTNNALADLCSAIANGNIDDISYVTQKLEWSNPLTVIAQHYINVYMRKNELERKTGKEDNYNFD